MAILPSSGKPTAKQVVAWAKWLADNNKGVDVDGRLGFQCWDLPNYIFDRYWGFRTYGNADAMARRDHIQIVHGRYMRIHLVLCRSRVTLCVGYMVLTDIQRL